MEHNPDPAEVKSIWQEGRDTLDNQATSLVEQHLKKLEALMEGDPGPFKLDCSKITAIGDEWARVVRNWPPCPARWHSLNVHSMETQIDAVEQLLCNMLILVEKLTFLDILNRDLKGKQVGRYIDFHVQYSGEMPMQETQVFFGILTLFMGSLGIIFLNLGTDLWTGFFAGYSIDSIIDLFLLRFTDFSSERTDALKKGATPPAASAKTRATRC